MTGTGSCPWCSLCSVASSELVYVPVTVNHSDGTCQTSFLYADPEDEKGCLVKNQEVRTERDSSLEKG